MMRSRTALYAGIAFLAVSAPLQAQDAERAAVQAVLEAYAAALNASNPSAADSLWSDGRGVHIIEGAGVNHGWAEYRDDHIGRELASFENFSYAMSAIEPQVRGDVAWSAFRYELVMDTPRGHVEQEGRGTAVLEKQNGRWIISHMHTSGRRRQNN